MDFYWKQGQIQQNSTSLHEQFGTGKRVSLFPEWTLHIYRIWKRSILENTFSKFTIDTNGDTSIHCETLGNFIHHFSEDNKKVFKTGPPQCFTSRAFQGDVIKEETYFNKELVFVENRTLNILTYDYNLERQMDILSKESTHHTVFRLCEANIEQDQNSYTLFFPEKSFLVQGEHNYCWNPNWQLQEKFN